MDPVKVGISLEDSEFAWALARGLSIESKNMQFFLIKEGDSLDENHFEECDLILSTKPSDNPKFVEVVFNEREAALDKVPYKVYGYKECRELVNDLLFIIYKLTGIVYEFRGSSKCKLICFASQSGGCGVTTAAISTCKLFNRLFKQRCIYLNLCPVNDSGKYLDLKGKSNLRTLLYYLNEGNDFPLGGYITSCEEMDVIDTGTENTSFSDMEPKLMQRFLSKIDKTGLYDYLIVDIGNHHNRENRKIMKNAYALVLVGKGYEDMNTDRCENVIKVVNSTNYEDFIGEDSSLTRDTIFLSYDKGLLYNRLDIDGLINRIYGMEAAEIPKRILGK